MYTIRYSCQILIKFKFSTQIFEKYSYMKFYESQTSGIRDVLYGRTDGQTDRDTYMTKLLIFAILLKHLKIFW